MTIVAKNRTGADEYPIPHHRIRRKKNPFTDPSAVSNRGTAANLAMRTDRAVVADDDVLENNGEVPDMCVLAECGGLIDYCRVRPHCQARIRS